MTEQRWIDMEIKLSYQEVLLEELRTVVNEQYLTIEKMEKDLIEMKNKMKADEDSANPNHEKPPHY